MGPETNGADGRIEVWNPEGTDSKLQISNLLSHNYFFELSSYCTGPEAKVQLLNNNTFRLSGDKSDNKVLVSCVTLKHVFVFKTYKNKQ